jgi:hypothetical protein
MQKEINSKLPDGLSAEVTATAEAGSGRRLQQSFSMVTYVVVVPIAPGMVRRAVLQFIHSLLQQPALPRAACDCMQLPATAAPPDAGQPQATAHAPNDGHRPSAA